MKHFFKRFFPSYFGVPTAEDIQDRALNQARSHFAQLLNDRDLLNGQIAGYKAIIERLTPP